MQEIKKCQFCGSDDQKVVSFSSSANSPVAEHYIVCDNCGAQGPIDVNSESAILKWNSRIQELPQEEPTIVNEYMEKKYCPILGGNCRTVDCMMYVYTHKTGSGLDGRCGLVNTMYINSTECGA